MTVDSNKLFRAQADWFCPRYRYYTYHSELYRFPLANTQQVSWPYEPTAFDAFERQRKVREAEVKLAMQMYEGLPDEDTRQAILDTTFPQRFDHCSNCVFHSRCHGEKTDSAV